MKQIAYTISFCIAVFILAAPVVFGEDCFTGCVCGDKPENSEVLLQCEIKESRVTDSYYIFYIGIDGSHSGYAVSKVAENFVEYSFTRKSGEMGLSYCA